MRACREMGVERAAVPPAFPLATAEALRAAGIELYVDRELFAAPPAEQDARPSWPASGAPPRPRRPGSGRGRPT